MNPKSMNPKKLHLTRSLAVLSLIGAVGMASALEEKAVTPQSIIVVGQSWLDQGDTNGDGLMDYNEFRLAALNLFVAVDTNADDVITQGEMNDSLRKQNVSDKDRTAAVRAFFRAADTDRNNSIGYYEYMREVRSRFTTLDRQRDGKVGPYDLKGRTDAPFALVLVPDQK